MHILVVDDEPILQKLLESCLTSLGYMVSVVNNGLEALHIMTENNFGIVFMDVQMPVMDGITATQFLRKCEQGAHHSLTEYHELAQSLHSRRMGTRIPVVAVTGNTDAKEAALQAGMDEFINKPYKINTIVDMLDQFCAESTKESLPEKRGHARYKTTANAIVLFQKTAGLVIDISTGGMAINILNNSAPIPNKWEISFYCAATGTKIEKLPLKLAYEKSKKISEIGVETQIIGVSFDNPTALQQEQIRQHISGQNPTEQQYRLYAYVD